MTWELPSSVTRSLDRFALSRVQRLEGEDSIVPTVQLLSLDKPPFRKAGQRFYGRGQITADATGGCVVLSSTSRRCTVVVEQLLITTSASASILVSMADVFVAGGVNVFVPEMSQTRPLPQGDLSITQVVGDFAGQNLAFFLTNGTSPIVLNTEIVLFVEPPSTIQSFGNLGVTIFQNTITMHVSFSGRIWYSEE